MQDLGHHRCSVATSIRDSPAEYAPEGSGPRKDVQLDGVR